MTTSVHAVSGAPRAWRVLLGLTFKGLEYDIKYLEASKGEHKSPEFLLLNPRGTVPVLVDGDTVIRDSIGALAWLDRAYPETPLFGHTSRDAAAIWQTTLECADYLRDAANSLLFPILVQNRELPADGSDERATLNQAADAMQHELLFLEKLLKGRQFLSGDKPSASDAVAFPEVRILERAIDRKPETLDALGFANFPQKYPLISSWKTRVSALPGFEKTMPRHW